MMTQPLRMKITRIRNPQEVEATAEEQPEVGVDLLEEEEVGGDLLIETKTGIEKEKKNMKNGIKNRTLALMTKEVENTGLKITGGGTELDQIDPMMTPIMTPNQNTMTETMMTEVMMIGKEQEALHQVEEEIETDMRRETTVPAMRREEEEEEEAGAIAQITETVGDTIA